mmetsp:Transcript_113777/g.328543  ORF Transcript_113777/g.328543 Transcript_113777/m.328543 type:complete len:248 (+) Transcript_113777:399-1142(+)
MELPDDIADALELDARRIHGRRPLCGDVVEAAHILFQVGDGRCLLGPSILRLDRGFLHLAYRCRRLAALGLRGRNGGGLLHYSSINRRDFLLLAGQLGLVRLVRRVDRDIRERAPGVCLDPHRGLEGRGQARRDAALLEKPEQRRQLLVAHSPLRRRQGRGHQRVPQLGETISKTDLRLFGGCLTCLELLQLYLLRLHMLCGCTSCQVRDADGCHLRICASTKCGFEGARCGQVLLQLGPVGRGSLG